MLQGMIEQRIRELPEPWQRFMTVVGLGGEPIDLETAGLVAGLPSPSMDRTLLNRLRTGHLVRIRKDGAHEQVMPYHERIREIVVKHLTDAERREIHLALAAKLTENHRAPPGSIANHLHAAGELDSAAAYALKAAVEAENALAFDEAAQLYGKVLEWRPDDPAPLRKHAEALANAGRCADAAPRYVQAAAHAAGLDALQLELRACEQYLMGGHTDEGLALLDELCAATGLRRPRTPARAVMAMVGDLIRLKLRGLKFVERASADVDPTQRFRIDLCYSASRNLLLRDPMCATRFSTRALLLALQAGDPSLIVEGMAAVGASLAVTGSATGHQMLDRARAIADRSGTPYALGLLRFWSAFVDHTQGRWRESLAAWEEAALLLRHCRGVQGEIQKSELNAILAIQLLGRFEELARRTERAIADARASGNRYTEVYARLYSSIPPLAAGDARTARERIVEAIARAPVGDHYLRTTALKFECYCDLYEGRAEEGLARLQAEWPSLTASRMMRTAMFRMVFHGLRAGLLLAASTGDHRRARLAQAESDLKECAGADYPYAIGQTALLRAGLYAARGEQARALEQADLAIREFHSAGLELEGAYARRRKGELLGGPDGAALQAEADAVMRARGVADPTRFSHSQAPAAPLTKGAHAAS